METPLGLRPIDDGQVYHVVKRGNNRQKLVLKPGYPQMTQIFTDVELDVPELSGQTYLCPCASSEDYLFRNLALAAGRGYKHPMLQFRETLAE